MNELDPTPAQLETLERALLRAYGLNLFKMMAYQKLAIRLEEEVNLQQGFKYIVHEFVDLAVRGGWLEQLVRSAREAQPGSPDLRASAADLGVGAPRPAPPIAAVQSLTAGNPELERLVRDRSTIVNFGDFLNKCHLLTRRLCTIEIPEGDPSGTGWLVDADLLLTSYHVIESVHTGAAAAADVRLVFDRTNEAAEVTTCTLADNWPISRSRYAQEDIAARAKDAADDELDYALVRLSRPVGNEQKVGAAEPRGWVQVKENPPAVIGNDIVIIVQHPQGRPLEVAFGNILAYNGTSTRVRYNANTEQGSSGSPCLTASLEPCALHNVGGPGDERKYNQGVPLRRIIEDLKAKQVPPFWS